MGIGARMNAPSNGLGGSVRAWSSGLPGLQFDVTRLTVSSPITTDQMTTTQFGTTLLLKPADKLSDYLWLRPYGGIGVGLYRSTLTAPTVGFTTSDSQMAVHFFGGAELTFASMPSLGLSVDYGVRSFDSRFLGFDVSGSSLGLSGHWYIK